MVQPEKADAVCNLLPDPVKAGQIVHCLRVGQGGEERKVKPALAGVLTDPVDIFGTVSKL